MEKLDWLNTLSEDKILSALEGDALYVAESCGLETLFGIWRGGIFKQTIRITEKELLAVKKVYIRDNFDGSNVKQLARKLQVTENFVYDVLDEKMKK